LPPGTKQMSWLAFGAVGRGQTAVGSQHADLGFAMLADRKEQPGQILLLEHVQHVGLIFIWVGRAEQLILSVVRCPLSVVRCWRKTINVLAQLTTDH
jgi:hypothetical protein